MHFLTQTHNYLIRLCNGLQEIPKQIQLSLLSEVYQVLKTFPSRYIPSGFFDGLATLPIPSGEGKDLGSSIISMAPKSDDFWLKCDDIPAGFDKVVSAITKRHLEGSFMFKPTGLKRQKKVHSKKALGDDLI